MRYVVNIIEPTLTTEAGHGSTVVHSLCTAGAGLPIRLWTGRGARLPTLERLGLDIRPHFARRLRKLQAVLLYRRLLREPGAIVVPTAGRFDLLALDIVAKGRIPPDRVFLYFHRLQLTPHKEAVLRRLAARQPNVTLLGTTDAIERKLREVGFTNTGVVLPFPTLAEPEAAPGRAFRHVLVAGAARADKGFRHVVNFVTYLQQAGSTIPFTIQISGDHHDRYDEQTRCDLDRLRSIRYPPLTLLPETLISDEYAAMFRGAICLQPYDREEYVDKISGITLEALAAAAPVVTSEDTWMARTVQRFDAGVAVADAFPATLERAVHTVIDGYARYSGNAHAAGAELRIRQTWAPVIDLLRRHAAGVQ